MSAVPCIALIAIIADVRCLDDVFSASTFLQVRTRTVSSLILVSICGQSVDSSVSPMLLPLSNRFEKYSTVLFVDLVPLVSIANIFRKCICLQTVACSVESIHEHVYI